MWWRDIIVGVVVIAMSGLGGLLVTSDWPPYSGIARVNDLKATILDDAINGQWKNYCDAEKSHNTMAEEAILRYLDNLQEEYVKASGGVARAYLPCP